MESSTRGVQLRALDGKRSSQRVGRNVYSRSVRFVHSELADEIEVMSDWRKRYIDPVRRIAELGAESPKNALRIAEDGIEALEQSLTFVSDGGEQPLAEAIAQEPARRFATATIEGRGVRERELMIPHKGSMLRGDALRKRLDEWLTTGIIEESCAAAVTRVLDNPDWLDLSEQRFAIVGAASEMGPLGPLSLWGATIAAVDLPQPALWKRIAAAGEAGAGRLQVPVPEGGADPVDAGGADLLQDLPAVAEWLRTQGSTVVADRVYADGSRFVQLAGAISVLLDYLEDSRSLAGVSFLATPTDVFAVPIDIAQRALDGRPSTGARVVGDVLGTISARRLYTPNYKHRVTGEDGREWGISDCLIAQQGANYALAKNSQRWKSLVANERGATVSVNVAPPTSTRSVVKNRVLATAYRGASTFGVEAFRPETSSALMAALLVHDLRNASSTPDHPNDLFVDQAAHGGIWSLAHEPRSILPLAVLAGSVKRG